MDTRPIGIFDSGVGGLSIYREIRKLLPKENYIFIADQHNIPYGEKSKDQLIVITDHLVKYLKKQKVKLVVIACNTATCYVLEDLRKKYPSLNFVGTVPAVKPAAELSARKSIAVLSTPATSKSRYLSQLIDQYAPKVKVSNIGCYNLEDLIEKGLINSQKTKNLLKKYLDRASVQKPDYIVLGCTHYPFLKNTIKRLSLGIKTIDSGKAIAKRVKDVLGKDGLNLKDEGSSVYLTTGRPTEFSRVASVLLKTGVEARKLTT